MFRAGTYPQGTFTIEDVKKIADNYDPKFCEAPIWIGHPKMEAEPPALAWVGGCVADELGRLYIWFSSISDELYSLIQDKKFKRVSVEFWKFDEKPGWYLYAIGLTNRGQITKLDPIEFAHSGLAMHEAANFNTVVIQKTSVLQPIKFNLEKNFSTNLNNSQGVNNTMNKLFQNFAAEHGIKVDGLDDTAAFKAITDFFVNKEKESNEKIAQFSNQTQSLEDKIKEFEAKEILSIIELGVADKRLVASQKEQMKEFGIKHGADELKQFINGMPVQNVYEQNAVNTTTQAAAQQTSKFTVAGEKLTFKKFMEQVKENPAFANQFTEEEIAKIKKGEI